MRRHLFWLLNFLVLVHSFSVSTSHKWPLFWMSVKNYFLNSSFKEKGYMQQPLESFHPLSLPHKVCWLLQTLYRLGLRSSAPPSHSINSRPVPLLFLGPHFEIKDTLSNIFLDLNFPPHQKVNILIKPRIPLTSSLKLVSP